MKTKRIFAFIIDYLIISIAASIIFMLPIFENDYNKYQDIYKEYSSLIIESGSEPIDDNTLQDIQYDISKTSTNLTIIKIALLFFYFGVLSYFWNGQTIGKKIFHLQVTPIANNSLNPSLYVLRSIFQTNILPDLTSLVILLLCSKETWLNANIYISYASYIIFFLLIGTMIFRDDERGFHDLIAKTKVIQKEK